MSDAVNQAQQADAAASAPSTTQVAPSMRAKKTKSAKSAQPGWFCGAAVDLPKRVRLLSFFALLVMIGSLCNSQFGIMSLGSESAGEVNLVLFLVPVVLGVIMLGAVPGVILAFAAGMFIMFRAWWTPIVVYDFQMADPFLSVVGASVSAILMAAIVIPAARRWPANLDYRVSSWRRIGPMRIASIVIGCLAFSIAFAYISRGLMYLFVTPGGAEYNYTAIIQGYLDSLSDPLVFAEALLNGVLYSLACLVSVVYDACRRTGTWKTRLHASFARWLAFAITIVFLLSSSVSFCVETVRADEEANQTIMSELEYLKQQVDGRVARGAPVETVAEGYTPAIGGVVAIVHDHTVVSSNDPRYKGMPASQLLSSSGADNYDFLVRQAADSMLKGRDDETMVHVGLRAIVDENYDYVAAVPLPAVYKARTATLMYNGTFVLVMLVVVFLVVFVLLRRVVVGPIHRTNETLGHITEGDLHRRVEERDVVEFDELSTGINATVTSLKGMMDEVATRNEQDLVAAKAIQENALPREFPPFPDIDRFDIYASMKTAKEVGGDFYDFFLVEGDKLAFLVADVSGKGIPASLFMMTAKTQLRTYLESGLPVDEAVIAANHQLCIGNEAGMFVTCWVGVLDYRTGVLEYVNAGHNPPLLHGAGDGCADTGWQWMRKVSGMPLGLFDGLPYDKLECSLAPEDTLYIYTDGVTEAMDVDGNLFSEERLMETLERYAGMNARTVSVGIRRAITDFTKDAEQSDDITMLTLRYGVPPEARASMTLPADVNQLVHVYNFIHEELHRRRAPRSVYNPLDIAAEELFVNVCHYAYPESTPENPGEVRIEFEYKANPPSLTVSITDDGIPYNPLAKPDAVTPDDIADVPIGGLGILMAKNSVDEMTYERTGDDACGSNVLAFRKGW